MATGTATFTVNATALNAVENIQKSVIVRGTVSLSAATDTYVVGGLPVTITPLESIHSSLVPTEIRVWSQPPAASPNTFNYEYQYNPGTTIQNGTLQIWSALGTGAEYSGALTNPFADTIIFEATFVRI
jgi:hypothetical protein